MKLQKRFLRKYKDKNYYKFVINIPPELIDKAELKEGDELYGEASKHHITLKKRL